MSRRLQSPLVLMCCCSRQYVPVELRKIIQQYFAESLTNETIREAIDDLASSIKYNHQQTSLRCGFISEWDTSQVTDMSFLFENHDRFNEDISRWCVSKQM